jgi:hypothetical protein
MGMRNSCADLGKGFDGLQSELVLTRRPLRLPKFRTVLRCPGINASTDLDIQANTGIGPIPGGARRGAYSSRSPAWPLRVIKVFDAPRRAIIDGTGTFSTASAKSLRNCRFRVDSLGYSQPALLWPVRAFVCCIVRYNPADKNKGERVTPRRRRLSAAPPQALSGSADCPARQGAGIRRAW